MFRTLQDGVPKELRLLVRSGLNFWGDPGLRHKRTCRPPQVADSFLSRLIVALISPGSRPLARPNKARNSYAAGSHCI